MDPVQFLEAHPVYSRDAKSENIYNGNYEELMEEGDEDDVVDTDPFDAGLGASRKPFPGKADGWLVEPGTHVPLPQVA